MRKKRISCLFIALSIVAAVFVATKLYAVLPDCEMLWNLCTQTCGGTPTFVVYGGGMVGVECSGGHYPCSPNWGPWDCS
jgi:hypothetical protein